MKTKSIHLLFFVFCLSLIPSVIAAQVHETLQEELFQPDPVQTEQKTEIKQKQLENEQENARMQKLKKRYDALADQKKVEQSTPTNSSIAESEDLELIQLNTSDNNNIDESSSDYNIKANEEKSRKAKLERDKITASVKDRLAEIEKMKVQSELNRAKNKKVTPKLAEESAEVIAIKKKKAEILQNGQKNSNN